MLPKLITIDLDGTLLRNDCTISPQTKSAIIRCMEETDTLFVPCTGRSYQNSLFVLKDFPVFPYYINANGTTLVDGPSQALLYTDTIPLETGFQIYSLAKEYHTFIEIYHGLTAYDSAVGRKNLMKSSCDNGYITQLLHTNVHLEDMDEFVFKNKSLISKFHIVCTDPDEKLQLKAQLAALPGVFPISTTDFNIEVCNNGWSKREGLAKLCETLHILPEQVAALGDSENDFEMIQWAGTGIAMGNAASKVKEAATYITKSNEEDGIVHALKYLGLL